MNKKAIIDVVMYFAIFVAIQFAVQVAAKVICQTATS